MQKSVSFHLALELKSNFSLNKIYAGLHWAKRKKDADYVHQLVKYSLIEQNIKPKLFKKPVNIFLYFKTSLDISNTAYVAKLIEDALKGILIVDDSKKYVRSLHLIHSDNSGIDCKIMEVE